MKHIIFFLLLIFWTASASAQTPLYTAGITYCNGIPAHNPGNTGSKYAIDTSTWDLYVRSYGTTWSKAGDWLQFRTGTGTPAAPPTKFESVFAINAADSLYYYDGATWNHLNPASTGGVTGSGTSGQVAYWSSASVITGSNDLFWDAANARLGIATTTPAHKLDILTTANTPMRLTSSSTGGTTFVVKNTSAGSTEWAFTVAGSAQPSALIGDFFFYNQTTPSFSGLTLNPTGEADFWLAKAAPVRFYNTGTGAQIGQIRTDALIGMPFFAAYNDVSFALAQTTSGNIKRGLNMGPSASLEWTSGTFWYSAKDVGFDRASANTLNLSDGSTGHGNIRLNTIRGKGTTNTTWSLRAANSLDSVVVYAPDNRRFGVNTTTPDVSVDFGENTDGVKVPQGTTAQRPSVNRVLRNNTDVEGLEYRENGVWFRLTSSQAPSIAAGAAAGTGPTVAIGAGSNDLGGTIEITTGTSTTTGTLATITYGDAFDAALSPSVTITPANAKAAEHMLQWHKGTSGNSSFVLTSRVALDDSTLYVFTYQVQQ